MPLNLIERVICAQAVLRSQSKYARGDHRAALDILVRALERIGLERPTAKSSILINLLYAELAERNLMFDEAYMVCLVVIAQVEKKKSELSSIRQHEDEKYILFRCKWLLARLSAQIEDSLSVANSIKVSYSSLQPDLVTPYLKSLFPVSANNGRLIDDKLKVAND